MGIDTGSTVHAKLNIKDTGNNGAISQLLKLGNNSSGAGTGAGIQLGAGSGNAGNSVLLSGIYDGTGTSFTIQTCNTFGGSQSEKFRVNHLGNVKFGSGTPGAKLHVEDANTTAYNVNATTAMICFPTILIANIHDISRITVKNVTMHGSNVPAR